MTVSHLTKCTHFQKIKNYISNAVRLHQTVNNLPTVALHYRAFIAGMAVLLMTDVFLFLIILAIGLFPPQLHI